MKLGASSIALLLLIVVSCGIFIFLANNKNNNSSANSATQPSNLPEALSLNQDLPPFAGRGSGTGSPSGLPMDDGANRPPSLTSFKTGSLMRRLGEILSLSADEQVKEINELLSSPFATERALGALAAKETGILSADQIMAIAEDEEPLVPLQLMGWLRDQMEFDGDTLKTLNEAFSLREDFNEESLLALVRSEDIDAPAARAILDLMSRKMPTDQLKATLNQFALEKPRNPTGSDIQAESILRLAELSEPSDISRLIQQQLRNLPASQSLNASTPVIVPGQRPSPAQMREIARQAAVIESTENLRALSSRYVKPPQIIESEGNRLGAGDVITAWNYTNQQDLDLVASMVERAIVTDGGIAPEVSGAISGILEDAASRNPLGQLTDLQNYSKKRLVAALPSLGNLDATTGSP